jgi:NAD(P)H-nitrite reductase large subunit
MILMAHSALSNPYGVCPKEVVCDCLQVTAAELLEALATRSVRTLKDLKRETGAGDGGMACHRLLLKYLGQHADYSSSASPICSER